MEAGGMDFVSWSGRWIMRADPVRTRSIVDSISLAQVIVKKGGSALENRIDALPRTWSALTLSDPDSML
jgi:hypothetical protein